MNLVFMDQTLFLQDLNQISSSKTELPVGKHSFPFVLSSLPKCCPTSFDIHFADGTSASVSYSMTALLTSFPINNNNNHPQNGEKPKISLKQNQYKVTERLIVWEQRPEQSTPLQFSNSDKLSTAWWKTAEEVMVKTFFQKDYFFPKETIRVRTEVTKKVPKMSIEIHCEIRLTCQIPPISLSSAAQFSLPSKNTTHFYTMQKTEVGLFILSSIKA